ncbi:MAG: hypothetical protein NZ853_10010 [Leptospiraceae bacterium]|nr:hypothetical protein [Leptospiraceae bacterium]
MKKITKTLFVLVVAIGLVGANCQQKKKDDRTPLLLLGFTVTEQQRIEQERRSGNCAFVAKQSSGGNTYYVANLSPLPKGACNVTGALPLLGTTPEEVKNKIIQFYQSLINLINAEFTSECPQTKGKIEQIKTQVETFPLDFFQIYVIDPNKIKFYPIQNLIEEGKNFIINIDPNDEIANEEDLKTLQIASVAEYERYNILSGIKGFAQSPPPPEQSCVNKMEQVFNNSNISPLNNSYKKNSKVISAICYYGQNLPSQFANQKCTSLNEEF